MSEETKSILSRHELPEGTVTFLFSDIEGSTELLKQLKDQYTSLLADQRRILRDVFSSWNGQEVDTQGDAFFYSFPRATEAVSAAVEVQRAITSHTWPEGAEVRIRMGLHTGEPSTWEEGYVGMDVHRAARIAHVGHGGQVLLSETTAPLVRDELPEGVSIEDLGRHLLKDMHRPERIRQLVIEDLTFEFPPLTSLEVLPTAEMREPRTVGECPYRGLSAFREEDAPFFHGRETFTGQIYQAVASQPIVVVIVGSSGSGKSSAVFAGLTPRLQEDGYWGTAVFRPRRRPFHSLAGTLVSLLEPDLRETDQMSETVKLAERLSGGEIDLVQVVERVLDQNPSWDQLLIIVDQFEELYTLCSDTVVQRRFIDVLLEGAEAMRSLRDPPLVILLTMRADFMEQALTHRPFADVLQDASLIMGPMTREELRTAIEKPAELQGAGIESGLVERLLDDVGEEPGNLPLLEFALTLLWERSQDGWLTHEDYEAIGCVDGALASYADDVFAGLNETDRERARRVFVQLVRPGEGTADTRRVATFDEFGIENRDLVVHLADKRLLVTGRDKRTGEDTVELVHEALIRHWGELQRWMEEDRAFRAWQERLRASLREWEDSQRDEGALLRGALLAQAEEWLAERAEDLSEFEVEYIRESVNFRDERQRVRERRRRRTIIGLSVGLAVALVLVVVAVQQWQRAGREWQRAEEAGLVAVLERSTAQSASTQAIEAHATAQSNADAYATASALVEGEVRVERAFNLIEVAGAGKDVDPDLGMLIALNAINLTRSADGTVLPEAWSMLHQTSRVFRKQIGEFQAGDPNVIDSMISPDGNYMVTYGNVQCEGRHCSDAVTSIWEVATGNEVGTIEGYLVADSWSDHSGLATFELIDQEIMRVIFWDVPSLQVKSEVYLDLSRETYLEPWRYPTQGPPPVHVEYVSMSLDGEAIAITFGQESKVHLGIWDLDSRQQIFSKENVTTKLWKYNVQHIGENIRTIFNSDGELILIGTNVGSSDIWDVNQNAIQFQATQRMNDWIIGMDFSSDGSLLATAGGRPSDVLIDPASRRRFEDIKIWNVQSGMELARLIGHEEFISDLSFSPDGQLLVSASEDGTVRVWDVKKTLAMGKGRLLFTIDDIPGQVRGAYFSPDGTKLLIFTMEGWIGVLEVASSEDVIIPVLDDENFLSGSGSISLSLNPNGDKVVVASGGRSASVWNTEINQILFQITGHQGQVDVAQYSPVGDAIFTASDDGTIKTWDASSGDLLLQLESMDEEICDVVFHPVGSQMAISTGMGRTWIIDLPHINGVITKISEPISVERDGMLAEVGTESECAAGVSYTPDGNIIVIARGNTVVFLESETGQGTQYHISLLFSELTRDFVIQDFSISQDGESLVTACLNGPIVVWDIQNREVVTTLIGNSSPITHVSYSPDGRFIAGGMGNGEVVVWSAETGDLLFTLSDHSDAITDLEFTEDGEYLYTSSADGTVNRYLMDLDDLISLIKSRLTRDLTEAECQEYLHMAECPPLP
ncbi:MAG: hypothetical protein GTO18_12665 [Anaerolineales bacterium]|nr:hypothetical protein [Anaerolineales bacterium]